MGAKCTTEAPPTKTQRSNGAGHAVVSAVPSPIVSSFNDSLTSNSEKGSGESGCSGKHSFAGYVPLAKIMQWFAELSPASEMEPISETEVWSDGERESQEWRNAEDGGVNAATENRWDAPRYVSALDISSPLQQQNSAAFSKGQKVSGFRC